MNQNFKKMIFSFRAKLTAVAVLALLFVTGLSNLLIYRSALDAQFQQLRQQLMVIAQTASISIDADMLLRIPLSREGAQTAEYKTIFNRLKRIRDLNPSIKYVYTFRKTKVPGVWQFVVDLDPELAGPSKKKTTAYPGDKYDISRFPEMAQGFLGPSADRQILQDEWGVTLSGYAPLRNRLNVPVAVLGVDMDASDVRRIQKSVHRSEFLVALMGVLLSFLLGILISSRMTARIRRLIDGTRKISAGDLAYQVKVEGRDEISELSAAFNQMTQALAKSRRELEGYFFRVAQSFVRILEAKDKYTQGHSDRVGIYAERIALKMGMSREQAELLKKAGELHDIGKLAVHEAILTKPGSLTDAEWAMIRHHPVIGAEALKPICFHDIIISGIYSHHERPDGTGYPEKLRGDQVDIYSQIIAVADAYDAMTSTRSYRKAMDKRAAIEEIKKNTGTQFMPEVSRAFIELLENDHA